MNKLLLIISSSIITFTSISNLSNLNNNLQKNINNKNDNNSNQDDLTKLKNWHNGLSIEQDAQAKKEYTDAMIIKTTKAKSTNSFDTYSITFDNKKLQTMLKEKLLNKDAYNIIINKNTSIRLTNEANAFVNLPTQNNTSIKVRAFQDKFYIENNKMYFVDKDHANPYKVDITKLNIYYHKNANLLDFKGSLFFNAIDDWHSFGYLTVEEHEVMIAQVSDWFVEGYNVSQAAQMLTNIVFELIENVNNAEWTIWFLSLFILEEFANTKTNVIQEIVQNFNKIKSVDSKYHQGVYENFYFWGSFMNNNSIKPILPMTKFSEINDNLEAHSTKRDEIIIYEYDNEPLLDYNGYDSLWQYLNTCGETFNLNKIFKSYVRSVR